MEGGNIDDIFKKKHKDESVFVGFDNIKNLSKEKKQRLALIITIIISSIFVLSWMAIIGGFSGYFSGAEKIKQESSNPFSIIKKAFTDVKLK